MSVQVTYPTPVPNTTASVPSRADKSLAAWAVPIGNSNWGFAYEGTYFVANNATLATGIAGHAAPVVADTDTKPLLQVYNGTAFDLIPDYLMLEVTAAGTNGTIQYTTIYTDNKGSSAYGSGGTAITAFNPARSNGAAVATTGLAMVFGAGTATMTNSVKVGQMIVREVIPVVQDTVTMKFGGPNAGEHSSLTTAGTATNHCIQHFAPIIVGPGGNLNISQIRPSQTVAASYQFSFGFVLR